MHRNGPSFSSFLKQQFLMPKDENHLKNDVSCLVDVSRAFFHGNEAHHPIYGNIGHYQCLFWLGFTIEQLLKISMKALNFHISCNIQGLVYWSNFWPTIIWP